MPGNNGKVGLFGISYPGFYTSMGMIDSHPALMAASPQAPVSDWFVGDDLHHNGALFLAQNFGFFYHFAQRADDPLHEDPKGFHFPTPDGYDFFLRMGSLANADKLYYKGCSPPGRNSWRTRLTTVGGRRATSGRTSRMSIAP